MIPPKPTSTPRMKNGPFRYEDCPEESDKEDGNPREARVQQIRKGHIHRSPRAQFVGGKVEHRLISEKEKREGNSHEVGDEKRAGAKAVPSEVAAEGDEVRVRRAVNGFGARQQKENGRTVSESHQQVIPHIGADKSGIRIGGLIAEFRDR